ncbi:SDR family NAD(P)-dependent oxidoreductase [Marinicauda pacifica]|uniref:SDR family NAD(P)-dependent oxidoreductase n=1 Tax=Marinicauda pacifica TaxID=1133559 RepID=UPI0035C7DECE
MDRLKNKVALVTGASRGIGAAVARRLAKEGAAVAITYVASADAADRIVKEILGDGGRAIAIEADSADERAINASVERTVSAFGGLDILVNNAGTMKFGHILDLTTEDLDQSLTINLRAAFLASKAAASHMTGEGRIVSIGSNLATRVPGPGLSVYALSKSGLIGMTQALARDLGPEGITVNVVHPGSTDTDMNPADSEGAAHQRERMAIARYNEPEDVAALVAWLAGPEARNVTGTAHTIDSGTNA